MNFYIIIIRKYQFGDDVNSEKSYDYNNSCPACGSGAKLIDNLYVKGIKKNKDIFILLNGDIIISSNLNKYLIEKKCKIYFKPIMDKKNSKELPYYHFFTQYEFPRFSINSEGFEVEDQCKVCKRDGHFAKVSYLNSGESFVEPYKFIYNQITRNFIDLSDIFKTWELFGISNIKKQPTRIFGIARPEIIVSEKLRQHLLDYGLKNVEFEKVIIENIL